jgi:hypothetical protein
MRRGAGWILACAPMACGPVVVPGDGGGSGSAEDGPPDTTTAADTGRPTTVTATSGPVSTSAATLVDDGTDDVLDEGPLPWDCGAAPPGTEHHCTTGDPPSVCDPQPMPDVVAWVSVDGGATPPDGSTEPVVHACTIAGFEEGPQVVFLALDCDDGAHTLDIGTSVGIWFDTTGEFVLSVIHSNATWRAGDQLVTLRRVGGELVLAGASTPWAPDLDEVPADFFAPLSIVLLPDVCRLEPPWDGGNFIAPCYTEQRQALRFGLDGQVVDVYDRGVDQLSPYILLVQNAERYHDITCTDTSDRWYSWVAVPPILD